MTPPWRQTAPYSCWKTIWTDFTPAPVCWISIFLWKSRHWASFSPSWHGRWRAKSCFVYWQVSRGVEPRSHTYAENLPGKLWVLVRPQVIPNPNIPIRLNDEEDTRFFHCNIKSLNLLCNVMTAQRAHRAGCTETVFHRGEIVTECAHSNISVLKDGVLYSHPNDEFILRGIAKSHMIRVCYRLGIPVLEKPFTMDFLKSADEILVTSTTKFCLAADTLNGLSVGGRDAATRVAIQNAVLQDFRDCTGYAGQWN